MQQVGPIRSEADYHAALQRIDELIDSEYGSTGVWRMQSLTFSATWWNCTRSRITRSIFLPIPFPP